MTIPFSMAFPALHDVPHRFVLRHPEFAMNVERAEALARLAPWHQTFVTGMSYKPSMLRTAEQVHGAGVAVVNASSPPLTPSVDGLITRDPSVVLGIYVADCCAVYLHDPVAQAIGLVHAGKQGAALGIVGQAIQAMTKSFGSRPANIVVQLSPCIRPPAYEIDFAAQIRQTCLQEGIRPERLHDCGVCTSSDLSRFYSYRMEKGSTGRMLALLALGEG